MFAFQPKVVSLFEEKSHYLTSCWTENGRKQTKFKLLFTFSEVVHDLHLDDEGWLKVDRILSVI